MEWQHKSLENQLNTESTRNKPKSYLVEIKKKKKVKFPTTGIQAQIEHRSRKISYSQH